MWEHFEDLTSCPALTRRPDSLLLFCERLPLQAYPPDSRGVGVQGHRRTLFAISPRLCPLERSFQGLGRVPLLSELCMRSTGRLVTLEGANEAKAGTGVGKLLWDWWGHGGS